MLGTKFDECDAKTLLIPGIAPIWRGEQSHHDEPWEEGVLRVWFPLERPNYGIDISRWTEAACGSASVSSSSAKLASRPA